MSSLEERKEGIDGALLRLHELTAATAEDFQMQVPFGQMLIWGRCHCLSELQLALINAPVSCASLYVGASMAGECLKARVNGYGQQLCELCGARLNRVKYTTKCGVGKKCHPRCKNTTRLSPSSADPPVPSLPSLNRTTTDSGKPAALPNTKISPPSPPQPSTVSLLDRNTWKEQRFKMVRGNRSRISMMRDWHRLVMETGTGAFAGWTEMRAQFFEQDMRESLQCSLLESQRVRVVSSAEILGRELLHSVDVDHQSLRMSDIGCLRTNHKIGLQEIHADIQRFEYSHLCYIVIFYLVDTESTAVANVDKDELDPVWKMTINQAIHRFKSVQFLSERVAVGDALVMNGKTFHYGVGNPDKYQRFIGFLTFTPKYLPPFDSQEQFYPTGVRYG